jgi:VCBS repeat-containing protein
MKKSFGCPPKMLISRPTSYALATILLLLAGCGGGSSGGSSPVVAVSDIYYVNNPGDPIMIGAPGVLQNDSGSGLTAQWVSGPSTVTLNSTGSFSITSGTTPTSFTYQAVNGTSNAIATVTISINQPPVANNACVTTPTNTPAVGALSATDPEGQPLTYAVSAQGGKGTVNIDANGNYSYTPNNSSLRGMDKFTYQVTDSMNLSATGTVSVLIDDSANPGRVRIIPLGDSITAGFPGGAASEDSWVGYRRKLYNDLSALNPTKFGINFVGTVTNLGANASPPLADRDNEGHSGWRDDEIANGTSDPNKQLTCYVSLPNCNITGWLNSSQPDIVLLHIGTNGIDDVGGTSATDVANILDKIDAWETANSSPITVFLALIIGSPNGTTNSNVSAFNANVSTMAQNRIGNGDKIFIVNQQTEAGLNYSTDMGDDLHPNQTGYDKMADKWKTDLISSSVLPNCQ